MSRNSDSDLPDSYEEVRPSVNNLRLRFENFEPSKHTKSKSLEHLGVSMLVNYDRNKQTNHVQRRISQDTEHLIAHKESRKTLVGTDVFEKPPVPERNKNFKVSPPKPILRKAVKNEKIKRSVTMRNPLVNVEERSFEQDQIGDVSPLPRRINETFNDLSRSVEDVQEHIYFSPESPRRPMVHRSLKKTTSCLTLSTEQSELFEEFPEKSEIFTKGYVNDPGVTNDYVVLEDSTHDVNEKPVNTLPPLRPRVIHMQKISNNKGTIKKTQTISCARRPTRPENEFSTEEKGTNILHLPPKLPPRRNILRNSKNSTINMTTYQNWPVEQPNVPPLPPKSLIVRQMASLSEQSLPESSSNIPDFKRNSSDSEALRKLNQLKSIFASTSASESDKYNKSILLLIDIMSEAIQEKSSNEKEESNEYPHSALYSNIKEFVHSETKDYIKENQLLDDNRNINYDKLITKMAPKFVENFITTDPTNESKSDEEEDYEKVCVEEENESTSKESHCPIVLKKILTIIKEVNKTERNHLKNLEDNIRAFTQEIQGLSLRNASSGKMVTILKDLFTMQREFGESLEASGDELSSILQLFLDFEILFTLYVEFFCSKAKIFSNGSTSSNNDKFKSSNDLSELLLSRLVNYELFIETLMEELKLNGKEFDVAREVIEMLNSSREDCINAVETLSVSRSSLVEDVLENVPAEKSINKVQTVSVANNSFVKKGLESLIDCSQDDTSKFLSDLIPKKSYDYYEYGSFLLRGDFKVDNQKTYFAVFLFEKVMVLTKEISKENFSYKSGLRLNQLVILPPGKNKKEIKLKDYVKSKSSGKNVILKLEARSEEVEKIWRRQINKCLWSQLMREKEESKTKLKSASSAS